MHTANSSEHLLRDLAPCVGQRIGGEKLLRVCLDIGANQRLQPAVQIRRITASPFDQFRLLRVAAAEPRLEQRQRLPPFSGRVVGVAAVQGRLPKYWCRKARAVRQSRLTVGTETPSTSPISSSVIPPK